MAIISLEPNESFEHYHATPSRTIHLDGDIEYACSGMRRRMQPGEIIDVAAHTTHTVINIGNSVAHINCVGTSGNHASPTER